ncbi:hypothetical protein Syun_030224 [Stephania yunnanensis]|uniref:Polygalacturonase n=1 Tax=Stephania yunnanensis TaxID=152371 RepID=A0AAP0E9F6_9MAGN
MSTMVLMINLTSSSVAFAAPTTFNVVDLGAKGDGRTDSTRAFLRAWESGCASPSSTTIYVPQGRYLLNEVLFTGECKGRVTFKIDGTLVAPSDYRILGTSGKWITFNKVQGVSIYGGILDGQGAGLWACKATERSCPFGAGSLEFTYSSEITITGLTSMNSQIFHIVIHDCKNVKLQQVQVTASGNSPNTDGIHVQGSTDVTITQANIKTGDDCISIGPGTTNLWMENINCGPGHGISLGKAANEQGVQNVTVKTATFSGSQNGVRIKTWARPSTGYVKGSSGSQVAMKFDCSPKTPCSGIVLNNVDLTYGSKSASSSCINADGSAFGLVHPSSCLAA